MGEANILPKLSRVYGTAATRGQGPLNRPFHQLEASDQFGVTQEAG